jgi:DNA end-binding protein Ku
MPRPVWSGALSFGLVNIPVTMYTAVRDRGVHFHQLHGPDRSPVEVRRVCSQEGSEVPWEEVAKGYELQDGRWVLLSEEDLDAAMPQRSRTIDIEGFVRAREIDPIYYERPYLLEPREEGSARAYALLTETMRGSEQVALGRLALRGRERLVAIRSREEALLLSTMRFHDEVRSAEEIAAPLSDGRPTRKQVESALAVIEELSVEFQPERYHDRYRARLKKVIERKRKGQAVPAPREPVEPVTSAPDLMGALEQSLAKIRSGRTGAKRGSGSPRAGGPSRASGSRRG